MRLLIESGFGLHTADQSSEFNILLSNFLLLLPVRLSSEQSGDFRKFADKSSRLEVSNEVSPECTGIKVYDELVELIASHRRRFT